MNDTARALASAFWPGPLTLVMPLKHGHGLSPLVTAGLETVAIRLPAHPLMRAVLAGFGGPLAAPSANPSGRISPTTADHVRHGLDGKIAAVLDGGPCGVGLESTILAPSDAGTRLLREGGLPRRGDRAAHRPACHRHHAGQGAGPGPAVLSLRATCACHSEQSVDRPCRDPRGLRPRHRRPHPLLLRRSGRGCRTFSFPRFTPQTRSPGPGKPPRSTSRPSPITASDAPSTTAWPAPPRRADPLHLGPNPSAGGIRLLGAGQPPTGQPDPAGCPWQRGPTRAPLKGGLEKARSPAPTPVRRAPLRRITSAATPPAWPAPLPICRPYRSRRRSPHPRHRSASRSARSRPPVAPAPSPNSPGP